MRLPSDVAVHLNEGGTLVVPSRARAQAVRLAQAAAAVAGGRRVWASADVLGASGWLRREVERAVLAEPHSPRLLSGTEEWFLWRECVREATRELALVDPNGLAESLRRAAELAADFNVPIEAAPAPSEAGLLYATRRALGKRCEALGAATLDSLSERLAGAPLRAPLLRGFAVVPPRLRQLVSRDVARPAPSSSATPLVQRVTDAQEELAAISAWCEERLQDKSDARLLVILPGAHSTRERLAAMIRQVLDPRAALGNGEAAGALVGIEGSAARAWPPLIEHALAALDWLAGGELAFERICALVRAPLWTRPSAPARARLALALRERAFLTLDLRGFLGALQLLPGALLGVGRELSLQLTRAAAALKPGSASPRVWSERVSAALAAAGWPGARAGENSERQTVLHWHELLEEFGALEGSAGSLARREALTLLRELAARSTFAPTDEDVPVTVSPALADPVVRYDGVWVAGLSADAFPEAVQPDPFLPLGLQIAAGVPAASAAGRLAEARALLAAWGAGAGELVLSAPARAGDLELLPSELLRPFALREVTRRTAWLASRVHREGQTELVTDTAGDRWNARQRLPRGTRSLDLQNLCPFRAYAELRLGASPPEVAEPGVPATLRGVLLHEALQRLWERLKDSHALGALSEGALLEVIGRCVSQAAQATLLATDGRQRRWRRTPADQLDMFRAVPAPVARECRRAVRLIAKLCELERTRAPFAVEQAEQHTELTLGGATLHMRIDRVDRLEGGRAVLDYKSGLRSTADWYGERPTHPQLLAYAQALGDDVVALATVSVTARRVCFDGIAREAALLPRVKGVQLPPGSTPPECWRERQRDWRAVLERLIAGFLSGDARLDPRPGACSYCPIIDICRIGEAGALGALIGERGDE